MIDEDVDYNKNGTQDEDEEAVDNDSRGGDITQPENAFDGSAFRSQPIAAIHDQGGNIVTGVNDGMVSVTLLNGPDGSTLRCLDEDGFIIPLKDGLATIQGLYINEAGRN